MKRNILTAEKLCKSYAHNGGQVHILNEIDLSIYEDDFTVIMGASGSGKSTLLYTLSGMDRATAGSVIYEGKDITRLSEKELSGLRHGEFGFVFQQMHLVSNLTIMENVTVPGYLLKGRSSAETENAAKQLLEKMEIMHIASQLPSQCSGGEQQRCAIARALINTPKLLFADEPTGALNKRNTIEVLKLLSEVNRLGQSILMVTHDVRAALRATRLLYLEDGKIIGELTLPPFTEEAEQSREVQVNAWLSSMEW